MREGNGGERVNEGDGSDGGGDGKVFAFHFRIALTGKPIIGLKQRGFSDVSES